MARGRKTAAEKEPVNVIDTPAVEEKPVEIEEVKKEEPVNEIEELKKQLAKMQELLKQANEANKAPVIQVTTPESERVHFLYQAEVADDNVFFVGENGMYGKITGKSGSFFVPKNDLSRVNDGLFRYMLEKRWIIAVSGLTDDEREALGVNYKEGEYLDKRAFAKMVDLGEEMLEIYPKLCEGHKEMVAKRFYEAYRNGNPKVTRKLVVELNNLSKAAGSAKGDFNAIIEAMNAAEAR